MIKFVKLLTGDNVVSLIEDKGDSIVMTWPSAIENIPEPEENGPRTRVVPFLPHSQGHTATIHKSKVLFITEPVAQLKDYYEKTVLSMLPPNNNEGMDAGSEIKLDEVQAAELESN